MYIGPNMITNGLVLALDAANTKSYPGSGTVWNDLSGNNISGSLTNSPTFNSANGGSIVFDGLNDYIIAPINSTFNFCNSTNDLPFSTNIWCYINSLSKSFYLYNKGDNGDGTLESYGSGISTLGKYSVTLYDTSGTNQSVISTTSTIPTITWINLTSTYSGTGGSSGIKLYVNGIIQPTLTSGQGVYTRMRVQSTNLFLGSFGNTGFYKFIESNGRYSSFQFYNRELTPLEIQQNYNSTKSRFNL